VRPAAGGSASSGPAGLPWPEGDPGAVRDVARTIGAAAATVNTAGQFVSLSALPALSWRGVASGGFHDAVSGVAARMGRGSGALSRAAGALNGLATTLEDAQEEIRGLAAKVVEAEQAAEDAADRAALLDVAVAGAGFALDAFGPEPPHALVEAEQEASDAAARAGQGAGAARTHAEEVRRKAVRRAEDLCDDCRQRDSTVAGVVRDAADAAPTEARGFSMPGATYGRSVAKRMTVTDFKELSFLRAGIDPYSWNPSEGLGPNDESVRAVYAYYEKLGLEDDGFYWMKMAAIGGPLFYAGFKDIAPISDYYEGKFLTMQKAIFNDLAWQHEAYLLGGAGAIGAAVRKLPEWQRKSAMDDQTLQAWRDIESGDPARVEDGNLALIYREQNPVIQDYYDDLDEHGSDLILGQLNDNAETPIPGSDRFADYYDDKSDANIADFGDRFEWISKELWPKHLDLVNTPGAVEEVLDRDFDAEVDKYRQTTPGGIAEGLGQDAEDVGDSLLPDPEDLLNAPWVPGGTS